MAGGRAFKSNVRERREAERRMKQLVKRQRKEEKKRETETEKSDVPGAGASDPSA
jgi:hypothetical protein